MEESSFVEEEPILACETTINFVDRWSRDVEKYPWATPDFIAAFLEHSATRISQLDKANQYLCLLKYRSTFTQPWVEDILPVENLTNDQTAELLLSEEFIDREAVSSKDVVITLHGIRRDFIWQHDLGPLLVDAGFIHIPLDYGRYSLLRLLMPGSREKQIRWFVSKCEAVERKFPNRKISVVAHSFGSYIVANSILTYNRKFNRIIFCGSIVDEEISWPALCENGFISKVFNQGGRHDIYALWARLPVADAGPSGYRGFKNGDLNCLTEHLHPDWGHSHFFYESNYLDTWLPFLNGEEISMYTNEPRKRRSWLKICLYITACVGVGYLIWKFIN